MEWDTSDWIAKFTGTASSSEKIASYDRIEWLKLGGDGLNDSWTGYDLSKAAVVLDNELYFGFSSTGDSDVWRFSSTTEWTQIGGDGLNGSWASTIDGVTDLKAFNNKLYAGLGSGSATGNAEVWEYSTTTATWTQIGGNSVNSSWPTGSYTHVPSLTAFGEYLYAAPISTVAGEGDFSRPT